MNKFSGNKFILYAICVLSFTLYKVIKFEPKKNFLLKIQANKKNIKNIDQVRESKLSLLKYIDTINFPNSKHLTHKKHGLLAFNKNYFIDFSAKLIVKETKEYKFKIISDDGYRLFINDKIVSEFIQDRPAKNYDTAKVTLNQGVNKVFLTYFQGYANAALEVLYRTKEEKDYKHLGSKDKNIQFLPFE